MVNIFKTHLIYQMYLFFSDWQLLRSGNPEVYCHAVAVVTVWQMREVNAQSFWCLHKQIMSVEKCSEQLLKYIQIKKCMSVKKQLFSYISI